MPYPYRDYRGGRTQGRGVLPDFDFITIADPAVPNSYDAFAEGIGTLNKRYDIAAETDDKLLQALNSADVFQNDQPLYNELKQTFLDKLKTRQEKGDYENLVTQTRRDALKFSSDVLPFVKNQELVKAKLAALDANDKIGADTKQRIKSYILNPENYKGLQRDANGQVTNFFNPNEAVFAADVDMTKLLFDRIKGIESNLYDDPNWKYTDDGLWINKTTNDVIDKDEIRRIAEGILDSDPTIQSAYNRESLLGGIDLFNQQRERAILAAEDQFARTRTDTDIQSNPAGVAAAKKVNDKEYEVGYEDNPQYQVETLNTNTLSTLRSGQADPVSLEAANHLLHNTLDSFFKNNSKSINDTISALEKDIENNPERANELFDLISRSGNTELTETTIKDIIREAIIDPNLKWGIDDLNNLNELPPTDPNTNQPVQLKPELKSARELSKIINSINDIISENTENQKIIESSRSLVDLGADESEIGIANKDFTNAYISNQGEFVNIYNKESGSLNSEKIFEEFEDSNFEKLKGEKLDWSATKVKIKDKPLGDGRVPVVIQYYTTEGRSIPQLTKFAYSTDQDKVRTRVWKVGNFLKNNGTSQLDRDRGQKMLTDALIKPSLDTRHLQTIDSNEYFPLTELEETLGGLISVKKTGFDQYQFKLKVGNEEIEFPQTFNYNTLSSVILEKVNEASEEE